MFRTRATPALRTVSRQTLTTTRTTRRHLTTDPPHLKSRSWKSSALRWGAAVAGVYYYNTSPVFAEQPQSNLLNPDVDAIDSDNHTIDRLLESSKSNPKHKSTLQSAIESGSEKTVEQTEQNHAALQTRHSQSFDGQAGSDGGDVDGLNEAPAAQDLEEEAAGEGAFNPVTGEINWDCPCLGGMAYGPCGEEFRTAFSCFVYSTDEPKGMDCVEKFGAMQDCFRAHPEVYAGEIDDEVEDGDMAEERGELKREIDERKEQVKQKQRDMSESSEEKSEPEKSEPEKKKKAKKSSKTPQESAKTTSHTPQEFSAEREVENGADSQTVRKPKTKKVDADALPESESLVPKAAHDATDMSSGAAHSIAR